MARRFRQWPSMAVIALAALVSTAAVRAWWSSRVPSDVVPLAAGPVEVRGVVDGNTLLVVQRQPAIPSIGDAHTAEYRVRLLGVAVATPDEHPAASAILGAIAPPGPARIELDKRRLAADGRWLAYVYVEETLVNAELIARGAARYEGYPGDSQPIGRLLRQAQDEARKKAQERAQGRYWTRSRQ